MTRIVVAVALASLVACSGSEGSQGPQGPSGPAGAQGDQGLQGIQGPSGPSGAAGSQGVEGPAGPSGPSGPQGAQGIQGIQGFAGERGPAGLVWRGTWAPTDAYAANDAVAWSGSSYVALSPSTAIEPPAAEWQLLASVGAEGPTGPTGPQGVQGLQGPIGLTGAEGPTGPAGPTGPVGPTGPQGDAGPQGAPGADGVSVTSVAVSAGDADCAYGGSRFTSASGDTYACNGTPAPGATYRYAVFDTYDNAGGWVMGNDPSMFGGVYPSTWTDSNGRAVQMSADKEVLRTLFTKKGYAGRNAVVHAEIRQQFSSTDGRMVLALFRVKNSTAAAVNWTPVFWYTAYSGWGELASVALNGVEAWLSAGGAGTMNTSLTLAIPANRTSTVIFVVGGSAPYNTVSNLFARQITLAFRANSLALPAGLSFVDDLDTATGGWEQ